MLIVIGSFYMPHQCNKTLQELNISLTTITRNSKQKQLILCGDFNCPDISWEIGNINTCSPDRSTQQSIIDVTESAQLMQVHNSSTRESKLLDLVFTTNPTIVTHWVSVPGISDRTIVDWNQLNESQVQAETITDFSRLICGSNTQ